MLDEISLVFFQESETPDNDEVYHRQGAELFDLVNEPCEGKSDENKERVPCDHHNYRQVYRIEHKEDEKERDQNLIGQ